MNNNTIKPYNNLSIKDVVVHKVSSTIVKHQKPSFSKNNNKQVFTLPSLPTIKKQKVLPSKKRHQRRRVSFNTTTTTTTAQQQSTNNFNNNEDDTVRSKEEKEACWYTFDELQSLRDELRLTIDAFCIFETQLLVEITKQNNNINNEGNNDNNNNNNIPSISDIGILFEKQLEEYASKNKNGDKNIGNLLCIRGLERRLEHRTIRNEIHLRNNTMRKIVIVNSNKLSSASTTTASDSSCDSDGDIDDDMNIDIDKLQQQCISSSSDLSNSLLSSSSYDHIKNFYIEACTSSKLEAIRLGTQDATEALNIYRQS